MNNIKILLLLLTILLIEMTNLPLSMAENLNKVEIAESFKIYDETMGCDEGWTLVRDRQGIKVYHRKISLTPIKVFKGVAELETDLTTLCAFLMDIQNFPSWVVMCDSIDLLKPANESANRIDQVAYYIYTVNRPPWPVKPRDNVVYVAVIQDPESLALIIKAIALPDLIPHKQGFVRCPLLMIQWKLRPLDNGNVEFTFETIIDAGGWVPAWIINFYAVDIPHTTILNIREQMPFNEKYKQQQIKWLKVPPSHTKDNGAAARM